MLSDYLSKFPSTECIFDNMWTPNFQTTVSSSTNFAKIPYGICQGHNLISWCDATALVLAADSVPACIYGRQFACLATCLWPWWSFSWLLWSGQSFGPSVPQQTFFRNRLSAVCWKGDGCQCRYTRTSKQQHKKTAGLVYFLWTAVSLEVLHNLPTGLDFLLKRKTITLAHSSIITITSGGVSEAMLPNL